MSWTCPECDGENPDPDEFLPSEVQCGHCGRKWETDFDNSYDDDGGDSYWWWPTKEVKERKE